MSLFFHRTILNTSAIWLMVILVANTVFAHNKIVHQDIVDVAYEFMLLVEQEDTMLSPPPGVSAEAWNEFRDKIAVTPSILRMQPSGLPEPTTLVCAQVVGATNTLNAGWAQGTLGSVEHPVSTSYITGSDCGVRYNWKPGPGTIFDSVNPLPGTGKLDHTGLVLGFWAASVDDEFDDTHLWIRPNNALGMSHLKEFINDAIESGISVLLLPFVCLIDCIFSDCNDCGQEAQDIADDSFPIDDLEGLLPGIGDISGSDFVGMWHHIKVSVPASNEFDNHQGWLLEESGPIGPPDPLDLTLMALFDASGLSVNHDESLGIHRYQIANADDDHPNTIMRDKADWQMTSAAHVAFEPIDNLAYFGWKRFRDDPLHPVRFLGWPLHAIGDAIVPMHVAATSAWGHRPFEDAYDNLWSEMPLRLSRIFLKAFEWREFILNWRTSHPGHETDVPVRNLVTALADKTMAYSMAQQILLHWPFDRTVSTQYVVAKEVAIAFYEDRPDAMRLGRPLIEDGIAATIALLISTAEVLEQ